MNDARDYHAVNKDVWEHQSAEYQDRHGALLEAHEGQAWGVWRIPEAHLQVLGDVEGAPRLGTRVWRRASGLR
jgi:hypothetical protein